MADKSESQNQKGKHHSVDHTGEKKHVTKPEQVVERASNKGLHEVTQAQMEASKDAARQAQEKREMEEMDKKIAVGAFGLALLTPYLNEQIRKRHGSEVGYLSPGNPAKTLGTMILGPNSLYEKPFPGITEKLGRGMMVSTLGIGIPMSNEFKKMLAPENRMATGTRAGVDASIGYGAAMLAEAHPVAMLITGIGATTALVGNQIFNPNYQQRNKDIPDIVNNVLNSKGTDYYQIIHDAQRLNHGKIGPETAYGVLDTGAGLAGVGARSVTPFVANHFAAPKVAMEEPPNITVHDQPIINTRADGGTLTKHPNDFTVEHHPAADGGPGHTVVRTPDGKTIRTDLNNYDWSVRQGAEKTTYNPSENPSVRHTGPTKEAPQGRTLHETPDGTKTIEYENANGKSLVVKNPNTNEDQFYLGADGKYYKFNPKMMKDTEVYPGKPPKEQAADHFNKRQSKDSKTSNDGEDNIESLFEKTRESALAKQAAKEQAAKGEKANIRQPGNKIAPYQEKIPLSPERAAKLPKKEELESLGLLKADLKQGHLIIKTDPERALGIEHIEILKGSPLDVAFRDNTGKFHECKLGSEVAKRLKIDQIVAMAKRLAFNSME